MRISRAPIVYIENSFYVISGYIDYKYTKIIARLDATRKVWSKSGELISGRQGHNAIFDGSSLIVVGGWDANETERCLISNGQATCTGQDPELVDYYYYPALFLVPINFCKTLL